MFGPADVMWGGVLPGAVAALALGVVWKLTRNAASSWRTAFVLSYVVGHWALVASNVGADGRSVGVVAALSKSYQPHVARDWLPLAVSLAIVPDAVACVGGSGPAAAWLLRIALCIALPWRLLRGSAYLPSMVLDNVGSDTGAWSGTEAAMWIGGAAAALLIVWQLLRQVTGGDAPRLRSSLAMLVALGAATTLALSGSFTYGQLAGVLTASLAGCALASMLLGIERGPDGAAGPLVIGFGSVLIVAYFFAELKLVNAVLLLLAMALAAGWLPRSAQQSTRAGKLLRGALCLAALTAAVAVAAVDFAATQSANEGNPYTTFQP